ncbi:hypothetical protein [Roseibium sp. RKSG952]|uniref:hypothetical protein n=1 Tax=Roseibium sp. RKSG952 TaxID=2529384 RepID=UPI0012BBA357|nr:hypothetical protein [Roseibium sp. RKSG952]MTI03678.1 hypothetical protein [Roseibium sp. RKSG952]
MKQVIIATSLALFAATAQAEVRNYECSVHSIEAQGWIPPRVILSIDPENKRARAFDGAIISANELAGREENTPVDARFKSTRKGEYEVSWRITLSSNSTRKFRVNYTAKLNPETNKLNMRANFPMDGLANRPKGDGVCKLVSKPSLY